MAQRKVRGMTLVWAAAFLAAAAGTCLAQNLARPHHSGAKAPDPRTERAGLFLLETDNVVYVPQRCVGRPCPLIAGWKLGRGGPAAEKYGMILLATGNYNKIRRQDLETVFHRFAIDRSKIAVVLNGMDKEYAGHKLAGFSRIITSAVDTGALLSPAPTPAPEYVLISDLNTFGRNLRAARVLRNRGYPVKHLARFAEFLENFSDEEADADLLVRSLQASWASSKPAARSTSTGMTTLPQLTPTALTQLAAFWSRMVQEPDSLQVNARLAHAHEVVVLVGDEHVAVVMDDLTALAAQYPAIAADLKAAGLTAQQHDAYRAALVGARLAQASQRAGKGAAGASTANGVVVDPASTLAKNVALLQAQPELFQTNTDTEAMWLRMWNIVFFKN